MGRKVKITLNDALYNAGVLGFLRVCESSDLEVKLDGSSIIFDSDIFEEFTANYLQTLIDTFRDDTIYAEFMKKYTRISVLKMIQEEDQKIFEECFKYIAEKLKRASYLAGFEIIKDRGEKYDFLLPIKAIKEEIDYVKKVEILDILIGKMKQYEDVFILKDVTYTKIQPFWTNVAFLNKNKNKAEFTVCFDEAFTQPAYAFTPKQAKKTSLNCCQCDVLINKSESFAMSWITDIGVDVARKTSYFWNYQADSFLCPVCNVIYACIPLGFTLKGAEGIFVNDNESVSTLKKMNTVPAAKLDIVQDDIFYRVVDQFININQNTTVQKEVHNIQVIRKSDGRYIFNILSKEKMQIIYKCKGNFEKIIATVFKIQEKPPKYINVYRNVIQSILSGENLYPLMYTILHVGIKGGVRMSFMQYVIKIQAVAFSKGGGKMREEEVKTAMELGATLRDVMLGNNNNENKIPSLSYKLLNALKVRNPHEFMDTIVRIYIGFGMQMPVDFLNVIKDEEQFLNFGYAFITGLNIEIVK